MKLTVNRAKLVKAIEAARDRGLLCCWGRATEPHAT
jgi:hypothetical protein